MKTFSETNFPNRTFCFIFLKLSLITNEFFKLNIQQLFQVFSIFNGQYFLILLQNIKITLIRLRWCALKRFPLSMELFEEKQQPIKFVNFFFRNDH